MYQPTRFDQTLFSLLQRTDIAQPINSDLRLSASPDTAIINNTMTPPASAHTADMTTHWSKMRESGTYAGLSFMHWVYRRFGRGFFRFVIFFVSIYFMLARHEQRKSSRQFLLRHYEFYPDEWDHKPGLGDTLRHFREFADTILDKTLAWSKAISEDEFDLLNQASIDQILQDPRGQLIIGTHLGNLEYCRGFMHANQNKVINVLTYDKHSANFARAMLNLNPESRLNIFQVDAMDVGMILQLKQKIDEGEWLFIAGDRVPVDGVQRTVSADFLGHPARFPVGPYHLALTLACPVKLMFAYKKDKRIVVNLVPFTEKLQLPKSGREQTLKNYTERFAAELQHNCRQVPFQWFNFYSFWDNQLPSSRIAPDDGNHSG